MIGLLFTPPTSPPPPPPKKKKKEKKKETNKQSSICLVIWRYHKNEIIDYFICETVPESIVVVKMECQGLPFNSVF